MAIKEYWEMSKEVFSNKNIMSIALTNMSYGLIQQAWNPFWPKYLVDNLGATAVAIGLISGIRTAETMLFSLPGGLLADKLGRKKIIVWGTFLRTFSPLIYLLAPSWEWIILAALFNGMTSIYMPAFTAIVADSMPARRRGTGYGVYNMITRFPNIISPIVGGICMDMWGYVLGLRIFLTVQIIVSLSITYFRWRYTEETIEVKSKESIRSKFNLELITEQSRPLQIMILVAIIGSFSGRLVMDFTNLYALEILEISNTQLGLIQTIVGIMMVVLSLPSGILSDKYGRKNNIMVSRVTNPVTQWVIAYATTFELYAAGRLLNGAAMAFGGGGQHAGGPAWNALIADLIPAEKRASFIGTQNTLTALVGTPSAILGGWLWETYNPEMPFVVSGVIGLVAAGLFWFGVDEPSKEEKLEMIEEREQARARRRRENKKTDSTT
ncbi:MFS transporter [Candidatus Bathyarchaeota archaeon]|nr:MFS transporter [Candidatus Bathyarchaeota archaeon]